MTSGELHVAEVRVRTDIAPELPAVWADANQLQQVLVNLINNAKQAMADLEGERRLRIAVRRATPERVRIEVEDTGPGIPPETGLSISYGIIREHGGTLAVDSAPGRGATFTIELPVEAAPRGGDGLPRQPRP